jgi:hypothetical protein
VLLLVNPGLMCWWNPAYCSLQAVKQKKWEKRREKTGEIRGEIAEK